MVTRSSVLAWRIPGTVEPDGLPSMGSHRVGHDWSDLAAAAAAALLSWFKFGMIWMVWFMIIFMSLNLVWYIFLRIYSFLLFNCWHIIVQCSLLWSFNFCVSNIMSSFSLLVLSESFLFSLGSLAKILSILLSFLEKLTLMFFCPFTIFCFTDFCSSLYYFLPSAKGGLIWFFFFNSLRHKCVYFICFILLLFLVTLNFSFHTC